MQSDVSFDGTIRVETPADASAVANLLERAFGGEQEIQLVNEIRRLDGVTLSLVALIEGQIVGHILFSPVTIGAAPEPLPAVGLSPLAVLPDYQRRGVGTRLVEEGLHLCREQGYQVVVVLGHPSYYPRLGFVPSRHYGVYCAYLPPDHDAFMVLELQPGALDGRQGLVAFHPAFMTVCPIEGTKD